MSGVSEHAEYELAIAMMNASHFDIRKMSKETGLPTVTLYAFRRRSIREPRITTLYKVLSYFRPKVVVSGVSAPVTPFDAPREGEDQKTPLRTIGYIGSPDGTR